MSIHSFHLQVAKSARYFTAGKPDAPNLIYLLHGYGQLANFFLQKFTALEDEGYYLVAPEGLHRFYWEGFNGKVVASWMTKEDREQDIADYVNYLNTLHAQLYKASYNEVIVLGFSQGVATAFRWLADGKVNANRFIISSGMIPADLNLEHKADIFKKMKNCYITGDADPFREEAQVKNFLNRMEEQGISLPGITFHGAHRIDLPSVRKALQL